MTESYMFLMYKADKDSFDAFEAFLSIRIIIWARQLNESYSTAADAVPKEVAPAALATAEAAVEMSCSVSRG